MRKKTMTVKDAAAYFEELCEQGLALAKLSFVNPEDYDNYYLQEKPRRTVVKDRRDGSVKVVELHLVYWE